MGSYIITVSSIIIVLLQYRDECKHPLKSRTLGEEVPLPHEWVPGKMFHSYTIFSILCGATVEECPGIVISTKCGIKAADYSLII